MLVDSKNKTINPNIFSCLTEENDEICAINIQNREYDNVIGKLEKNATRITSADISTLKTLCNIMNITILHANGEADPVLAKLSRDGIADFIISKDTDMLAFGCDRMIELVHGSIKEYDRKKILKSLDYDNMTPFIDTCILMGTHYARPVPSGFKFNEIKELIKKYGGIKELFDAELKDNVNISPKIIKFAKFVDNYIEARNIFLNRPDDEEYPENFVVGIFSKINVGELIRFFNAEAESILNKDEEFRLISSIHSINKRIVNDNYTSSCPIGKNLFGRTPDSPIYTYSILPSENGKFRATVYKKNEIEFVYD